jgi:hypothetical protein
VHGKSRSRIGPAFILCVRHDAQRHDLTLQPASESEPGIDWSGESPDGGLDDRNTNCAVEEHDLDAGPTQLIDQQHLVRVTPRESIGRMNVQLLNAAGVRLVAHPRAASEQAA